MSKQAEVPKINLFDVFLGKGRTIRGNPGPQGFPFLQTDYVRVRHKSPIKADEEVVRTAKAKTDSKNSTGSGKFKESKKDETKPSSTDQNKKAVPEPDKQHNGVTPFTTEQDAELLKMKSQDKTWKMIADQLGKPPGQCKHRYRDLQTEAAAKASSKPNDKDGKKHEKGDSTKPGKSDTKVDGKPGKSKPKDDSKAGKNRTEAKHVDAWKEFKKAHEARTSAKAASHAPSVAATMVTSSSGTLFTLTEDDMFSYEDLQLLVDVLEADNSRVWDRVASAFFNNTGRRISPGDIKGKIGPMMAGG